MTMQNFTKMSQGIGTPPSRVKSKYIDVGHVEGYISEMVQNTASGTVND